MHNRIDWPRYRELSENWQLQEKFELKFEKVKAVSGNRARTESEYNRMQDITRQMVVGKQSETTQVVSDLWYYPEG